MDFCLVFGEPGIGKSTAVAAALAQAEVLGEFRDPLPHIVYRDISQHRYACQLGRISGTFPGTDGLSYNIVNKVVPFIASASFASVIAEGDRLSNLPFISSLPDTWDVDVIHLYADDPQFAEDRRWARAGAIGKTQNASWVKGRRTKAWRLAESLPNCVWFDVRNDDVVEFLRNRPAFARVA
jgi:hypothetical protein